MLHFEVKDGYLFANNKKISIQELSGCRVVSTTTEEAKTKTLYDEGKIVPGDINEKYTLYSVIIQTPQEKNIFYFQEEQLDEIINECKKIKKSV